jgi:two-component system NarL family sensor kinase
MISREGPVLGRVAAVAAVTVSFALWVAGLVLAALDGHVSASLLGISGVGFAVAGALVMFQRPENRLGPLMCAAGVVLQVQGVAGEYGERALVHAPGSLPAGQFAGWFGDLMALPATGLLAGVLPQLFPTGQPVSRRWRPLVWAAWGYLVLGAVGNAFVQQQMESVPGQDNPYAIPPARPLFTLLIMVSAPLGGVALIGAVASLAIRWRRTRGDERQQLKWFAAGASLLPVALVLHEVQPGLGRAVFAVVFAVIPATLGVAILRYRLYDLDLVVRRTAVYAAVSAVVAGLYLLIVALAQLAVASSVGIGVHVAAAVAAAAAFQPLRIRVQRVVDRRFYGDRLRPYEAVTRLGRQLEGALLPETVLPGVVETVCGALRLPFAAIDLRDGDGWVRAAQHGTPEGEPVAFPMAYQATEVGRMLVCPRGRGDELSEADRRLLADLARQAGVAAHAVQVTTALQRSRAELVSAREEERRRLRRDLHDGLGPTLAGVTMGMHAAGVLVSSDPGEARRLLAGLEKQVEDAVADVRRLVYGLRPPALDEFGLVRALQLHASRLESPSAGLSITVDSPPQGLGPLPAAVEVAAYRIVTEALTNVARHARARSCQVRLRRNGALELEVIDDGQGLSPGQPAGVGMTAMRERATELGGTLTVEPLAVGTRVSALLPAPDAPAPPAPPAGPQVALPGAAPPRNVPSAPLAAR